MSVLKSDNWTAKHSTQFFITRRETPKFVKNTALCVVFSTLFSVFALVMKHCVYIFLYFKKKSR